MQLRSSQGRCGDKGVTPTARSSTPRAGPCPGPAAQHGPREQQEPSPHGRCPEFGPRSETQRAPPQSPTECVLLLHLKRQGLGNDFGNQSEGNRASLPLLLLQRNLLNTNLKDVSGYCACAGTAFPRNLNGISFLFYYVPKYIFTEQRLQSTGGREGRQ